MTDERVSLLRFAWLAIAGSVVVIGLKVLAYALTGSVGLLSDALESIVNLVAAFAALLALKVASQPADENHPFGYDKAEYFSSGLEGGMILVAASAIIVTAGDRLLHQKALEALGAGLAISSIATLINLAIARVLLAAGHRYRSIALEADGRHLMTDVWTSVGVVVGVAAAGLSGWAWLDPTIALLVGVNIVWTGFRLMQRSARGLMDRALPNQDQDDIARILATSVDDPLKYHALRTRQAGSRRFVEFHLLVPGAWTVQHGHDVMEGIEARIRDQLPNTTVLIHLEPVEDPASWADVGLDRDPAAAPAQDPGGGPAR